MAHFNTHYLDESFRFDKEEQFIGCSFQNCSFKGVAVFHHCVFLSPTELDLDNLYKIWVSLWEKKPWSLTMFARNWQSDKSYIYVKYATNSFDFLTEEDRMEFTKHLPTIATTYGLAKSHTFLLDEWIDKFWRYHASV